MAAEGFFAACIAPEIVGQIKIREERFGKPVKTDEELEIIHGNLPWAVLRSGVDAPKNPEDRRKVFSRENKPDTTPDCAKKAVLAGELQDRTLRNENSTEVKVRPAGIQFQSSEIYKNGNAYKLTEYQGHRPVAGITGISVVNRDSWGMVLEANVSIKVWSKDELEALDLVYFKPGFPALLEWGHTLYFDGNNNISKNPTLMIDDEEFFKGGEMLELDQIILDKRRTTCNQEALFGYITNFSFSLNKDGSYNCTLKILSKGTILEGLKIKGCVYAKSNTDTGEEEQEPIKYEDISVWHRILRAFDCYFENSIHKKKNYQTLVTSSEESESELKKVLSFPKSKEIKETKYLISGRRAICNYGLDKKWQLFDDSKRESLKKLSDFPVIVLPGKRKWDTQQYYITLRSFLHLFNIFNSEGKVWFNLQSTAAYRDSEFPDAVSFNPYIAVKPRQVNIQEYQLTGNKGFEQDFWNYIDKFDQVEHTDRESSKILNIWINFGQYVAYLDSAVENGKKLDIIFLSTLRELLSRIQKAFGEVNDFQVVSDHLYGGSIFEIIDSKNINSEKPEAIQVTGLNNTVESLSVQSEVTSNIANEMSIAAQAPKSYEDGSESIDESMVHWGENCTARWITSWEGKSKDTKSTDTGNEAELKEKREKWKKALRKAYEKVRRGLTEGNKEDLRAEQTDVTATVDKRFLEVQLDGEKYCSDYCNDPGRTANLQSGIIPIRAGLTMMGLGRLTVGTTFRLEGAVIPDKYKDWGYIVTGLTHEISRTKWTTQLKTQYYPIYDKDSYGKGVGENKPKEEVEEKKTIIYHRDLEKPLNLNETAFMKYFRAAGGYSEGRCLRWTSAMARGYVRGKAEVEASTEYGVVRKGLSGGATPMDPGSWQTLERYGYVRQSEEYLNKDKLMRKLNNSSNFKEGDVVMYWDVDGNKYHAQFYQGKGVWQSDVLNNYGCAFVYRKKDYEHWKFLHFRAPKMHSDWSSMT